MTAIEITVPSVHTERLLLRAANESDVDAFAAMAADPQFTRFIGGPVTNRAAAWLKVARQLGMWVLRGHGIWAVVEQETGQVIGRSGLWWEPGWPGLEAVWFIAPSRWGRGYAPEAARAALRFAFEVHNADRVVSVIRSDNTASIRVAEKIGETYDHTEHLHGADKHVYAISRTAWDRTRE